MVLPSMCWISSFFIHLGDGGWTVPFCLHPLPTPLPHYNDGIIIPLYNGLIIEMMILPADETPLW